MADKPTVTEVLPLVRAYQAKDGNGVGGSLHIVLDDGNTEDGDVEWCMNYAKEIGDADGVKLAEAILRMSKTQRERLSEMFYD